jgi:hypothetical protein
MKRHNERARLNPRNQMTKEVGQLDGEVDIADADYCPRLAGSTRANVRKSVIRNPCGVPAWVGSVGTQVG